MEEFNVLRVIARVLPVVLAVAASAGGSDRAVHGSPLVGTKVTYYGHCCFLVESPGGVKVLIDPYETHSRPDGEFLPSGFPSYALPEARIDADVVLVSHSHGDHDYGGISLIQGRWGGKVPVLLDGDLTLGDVHAVAMAGTHSSRNGNQGVKNVIWSIDAGNVRIVHWGDNAVPDDDRMRLLVNDEVRPLEQVDLLALPIDAGCHLLSYDDVERIRKAIQPRRLVPMHYVIPELQQGVAGMDLMETDWQRLGWGPLQPWLKGQREVVELPSNELALATHEASANGDVVVFRWPLKK